MLAQTPLVNGGRLLPNDRRDYSRDCATLLARGRVETEPGLLELARQPATHRLDPVFRVARERDVRHVVDAAGDDHLQDAFAAADVAEGAAHARRKRHRIEPAQAGTLAAVVVPR